MYHKITIQTDTKLSLILSIISSLGYGHGMSEDSNKEEEEVHQVEHPIFNAPGCGLASYSCLLLCFFLIGIMGMFSSLASIIFSEYTPEPFSLVSGDRVAVWRLQPLRDAKLLKLTEVPLYYHDESQNGTKACAMTKEYVIRLDGSDTWKIPYTDIESNKLVYEKKQVVSVMKTKTGELLPCFFAPTEGAERFRRYLLEQMH